MNTGIFPPAKRLGLVIHGVLLAALICTSVWGFIQLSSVELGPNFVIFLLVGLIAFAPLPLLGYRAYALLRATYILDRERLVLRWGLREETIPLSDIEWVRSIRDLSHPLNFPPAPMPGAVLGLKRHRDLGIVEFIAGDTRNVLLVATAIRVFAISPADPGEFIQTFARAVELGSLAPAKPVSVYPSFVITNAMESGLVRFLWLAALFLNLGLVAWIGILIPSVHKVALGFGSGGTAQGVPSVQLVILPLVSVFLAMIGWVAGLYFYRWNKRRVLSTIIWSSGTLMSLLFLVAVIFIMATPA